jgi:hypothetical protein
MIPIKLTEGPIVPYHGHTEVHTYPSAPIASQGQSRQNLPPNTAVLILANQLPFVQSHPIRHPNDWTEATSKYVMTEVGGGRMQYFIHPTMTVPSRS